MSEVVVCNSVNAVADAFSYGFPLGRRFASSFCSKFTGKREIHSVHMEYSSLYRDTHYYADFFSFSIHCIICCLLMVFFFFHLFNLVLFTMCLCR